MYRNHPLETPKAADSRVLVIEDELPLLDLIGGYLRRELQCEVHSAIEREEAEALLDCYKYSLVIFDPSLMPQGFEGHASLEGVADVHGRLKMMPVFGTGTDRIKSLTLGMGADVSMGKPRPLSHLASALGQLIAAASFASRKLPYRGGLLQQVLRKGGIVPVVQPIYKLDGGAPKLAGVECLSRGPGGTPFQRADALFAYARRKRVEDIVDQHCISVALKAAAGIPVEIGLALNVHASTLGRCADFCGWLRAAAAENSIDPLRLTIEIVEHTAVRNKSQFLHTLDALREAGIRIALDDIGLGHSNFQMMVDAKPDYLKLDRYLVHGCHRDKYRKAVVTSVAKLAEELDSTVIAEGVEDPADLDVLQDAGIGLVQGFLFCRPVRFDQLLASKEPGNFCACSLESRTESSQCRLTELGLCSRTVGQAVGNVLPFRSPLEGRLTDTRRLSCPLTHPLPTDVKFPSF